IFTQDFMSTKTIANPSNGPTYAISYDANDQGASYSETPNNVQKPFTSWAISGSGTGSLSGTTFTFGVGDNTLTANYGITSKPFNLPIITKTGHTCGWAKGSASGEQIVSGGSTTITKDTTFYAVCTPNPYDITIRTATGIDKVTLNGVDCTSTTGCVVSGLIFGQSYNLVAEPTPGYTFASWDAGSYGTISDYTSERTSYTVGAGNSTITPMITVNKYMLIVNPNGGIWESASYPQIFEQYYKTTKTINNPSNGPIYNISYDPNGQGATYTGTPTIIERPFTNWTNSGPGTLSGTTFTFGLGNNILIANYDTASNPFNLPTITKLGHTCSWAEGSPSGPQTAGGVSITISSDTTFYAVCTPNPYDITIKTVTGISKVTLNGVDCTSSTGCTVSGLIFDQSYNLVAEVEPGYTFASWSAGSYGSISDTTATSTSYTVGAGNSTITPSVTINKYTLTVNPNGGTWSGSTSSQTFTQNYGTTKTIADPTAGPTYSISYNANGQGASYTGSPTSVQRPFTSWTISDIGTGTLSGTTFTYGIGDNTLTANYNTTSNSFKLPAISKTGYSCKWAEGSTTGTQYAGGTSRTITANTTYYAVCSINSYTLTVNPNGGTWSGKTTSQTFTQNYGTTKTIANPSATPSYSISYNGNSQGASYTGSPTSVSRSFTSWSKSGSGTLSGTTFTFGAGNGTLTANYNTTSNSFKLPAISKTGHSCKWAEGSTSGTQYAGGTSRTITGNKTYYAMCSANSYNITVKTTTGISSVTINGNTCTSSSGCTYSLKYNSSYNISASVVSGASFSSWSAGAGSFGNASASSTTYTVKGAATITPSINTSTTPIMQDFSASTCKSKETANVIDSRDNHIYSVRYITRPYTSTGACFMTTNLSYGCSGDTKTSGSLAAYCSSSFGAWYSYSNSSSVCPSGWHPPTWAEAYILHEVPNGTTGFNPVAGGGNGGSYHRNTGYWWLSGTDKSYLHYRADEHNYVDLYDDSYSQSGYNFYVRCVRS
ncbi:MAG: hypothetical protein Q4F58_01825, partial [Candidatus Saccharibacteria bacterium]|nr:hypothetical protein [Candidatus Saccharibacteria bacterium]